MYESRTRRTTDQDSVFEIVEVAYDRRSRVRFGTVSPMLVDLFRAQIRGCIGADFLILEISAVEGGGGVLNGTAAVSRGIVTGGYIWKTWSKLEQTTNQLRSRLPSSKLGKSRSSRILSSAFGEMIPWGSSTMKHKLNFFELDRR